eukprot:JP442783.1.p3 GENE.JP442783.1~~JP442783.1.p3  ORF type:complete len:50 (+),score=1.49 JP442783.1:16-165(+)
MIFLKTNKGWYVADCVDGEPYSHECVCLGENRAEGAQTNGESKAPGTST